MFTFILFRRRRKATTHLKSNQSSVSYSLVFGQKRDARDAGREAFEFVHYFALAGPHLERLVEAAREHPQRVLDRVLLHAHARDAGVVRTPIAEASDGALATREVALVHD